jgi:hypothetical protein
LLYVDQKQKKSSQISCPARSTLSKEDGICYCDVGYIVDQTKTKCEKEMINVDYAKINKLTYVYETKSTKAKKLNKAYRDQKLEVLEKSKNLGKSKSR